MISDHLPTLLHLFTWTYHQLKLFLPTPSYLPILPQTLCILLLSYLWKLRFNLPQDGLVQYAAALVVYGTLFRKVFVDPVVREAAGVNVGEGLEGLGRLRRLDFMFFMFNVAVGLVNDFVGGGLRCGGSVPGNVSGGYKVGLEVLAKYTMAGV